MKLTISLRHPSASASATAMTKETNMTKPQALFSYGLMMALVFNMAKPAVSADFTTKGTYKLPFKEAVTPLSIDRTTHTLYFNKPETHISARLCELSRQPDGTWQRDYVAPGIGISTASDGDEDRFRNVLVMAKFLEPTKAKKSARLVEVTLSHETPRKDRGHTAVPPPTGPPHIIDGCLVIASREVRPRSLFGTKASFTAYLAIELEIDDSQSDITPFINCPNLKK
ncbi:hypothetical protein ACYOEI_09275 [Singulisphaera rosea]